MLGTMSPDVDWPNAWEGGRVVGHEDVRDYWMRQWAEIDPTVVPAGFEPRPDGRVAVAVDQTVRSLDGTLLTSAPVCHVYTFSAGGLVLRMDIEEVEAGV